MSNFSLISKNWNMIVHQPVISATGEEALSSLKGRGVCLIHTLATPVKFLNGLGKVIIKILNIAYQIIGVLTCNLHPKSLKQVAFLGTDAIIGGVLLPFALLSNVIRGIIGTTLHPGAMIREDKDTFFENERSFNVKHNILWGTLVNY